MSGLAGPGYRRRGSLAAREWSRFRKTSEIPDNLGLPLLLGHFPADFKPLLFKRFRSLRGAPPELIVLIIAEGIAASGGVSRSSIERQLGITLPDRPIADIG